MWGTFIFEMDREGHVVMPWPLRRRLGTPFVLARAPGRSLLALSSAQWESLRAKYQDSEVFRSHRSPVAVECPVDETNGRFLIPAPLREYADLGALDEVAISDAGTAVRVVKRSAWERLSESRASSDDGD